MQRENKSKNALLEQRRREAAYQSAMRRGKGWRARARNLHDSVLDTCKTLEGWYDSDAETLAMRGLPVVPSGLMTVDFHDDSNWSRGVTRDGPGSVKIWSVSRQSLLQTPLQTPNAAYGLGLAR